MIAALLLPPLPFLLLCGAGLLLWHRRPRVARFLVTTSFLLLWLCSTPIVVQSALRQLEGPLAALDTNTTHADAIVVLGGGTYFHAPEYGGDTVPEGTLMRLRYAAKLQRATGKPLLAAGGKPLGNDLSEAQQMKAVLEQEFKVQVRWTEDASNNTLENSRYSHELLGKQGIRRIYLVTHAWHMRRAARAFREAGFEVVPAPTAFTTRYRTDLMTWLPNASALRDSKIVVHEAVGLLWYRVKSGQ